MAGDAGEQDIVPNGKTGDAGRQMLAGMVRGLPSSAARHSPAEC